MSKKFSKNLTFNLVLLIFRQLLITLSIIILSGLFFITLGEVELESRRIHPIFIIVFIFLISILISTTVSIFVSKSFLRPIHQISQATKKIANGDFDVSLDSTYAQSEISELIDNFNIMAKDLKNIEILKNDFIDNVSHEFKTPLSTISGYSALLQDENLTIEERRAYTQNIIDSSAKLNALLSNILKLSKLENGEIKMVKNVYAVDEQIRQAILSLEKAWSDKNIDLDIELDNCKCLGYEQLNEHIWLNIISNAIKFSNYGGKVEIYLKKLSDTAIFSVTDYGIGMDTEIQNKIFDKFYQGDNSHNKEGNGLGLALVKKIVRMNDYDISVKSVYGQGSTFTVTIPLK